MHIALKNSPENVLNKVFGYKSFRGNQKAVIDNVLNGSDTFVLMPTGGGKSLCYQIPALCLDGMTVVVSPLIALMQDQVYTLKELGVKAEFLNSTLSEKESLDVIKRIISHDIDLLYVSPERLNMEGFQDILKQVRIPLFAIDEAHCVSQWGHDFRPEYTKFSVLKELFPNSVRMALTATADEVTRGDIIANLHLEAAQVFISSFDRPNIEYSVRVKDNEKKQLLDFIKSRHEGDSGIVYCISRKRVEAMAEFLKEKGFKVYPYHAGLSKTERERNQERFLKEDGVIMTATIAFGMGIDKPDVRFVAHMDLPKSVESYYQETGRAGRDGLASDAWMVYGLRDIVQLQSFINQSTAPEEQKRIERIKLNALIAYVESTECRRKVLLEYFSEKREGNCGNCDNCLNPPVTYDATVDCQKVLSCIYRANTSTYGFGAGHIVNILLGKEDDKILKFRHNKLSTFGIGKDTTEAQWRAVIRQLIIRGYIDMEVHYQSLKLTAKATDVLKGLEKIELRKYILQPKEKVKKNKFKEKFGLTADEDMELFKRLKDLRMIFAKRENLPPYVIFHDRTLMEMVCLKPKTYDELREITGIGERKLEKYGLDFLKAINGI